MKSKDLGDQFTTWGNDKKVKKSSVSRINQKMIKKDEPRYSQQGLFNNN